ncbi:tyrosine-type recombinase/integrase [Aeromonas caviae]|uniref:tyrosine-type recombinase/integrase n=1 Tax=Aeromonas caviae TaxID=648 RepID=UPI002B484D7B|nr:tyrosine-type recombinase/integrase [Aeromonas caviae]
MNETPTRFKFTNRRIADLPPNPDDARSTEAEYSDTDVTGLRCLVGKGEGRRKFLLRYQIHGRKRAIALGHYPALDISAARKLALDYKRKIAEGIDPQQAKENKRNQKTLSNLFQEDYLPYLQSRNRSWKTDEHRFRNHLRPIFGNLIPEEITVTRIQNMQQMLLKRLTPATCNRVLALLKAIITWAARAGLIKDNPAALVSLLRENNRRERYFTPDEIRRLFRAADQHESFYTGQYVKMLLLTGLRRAELARAKWQHYNKEDKTLYIPHTKNGHSRVLHLNHMAVELLNYLPVTEGNPYLFPGKRQGQPLQNPTKGFQRMLARAGIDKEGVCLHTCRHSVAALIVSNGGTLFDVQSQLGHRSSQTSLRYAHLHNTRMQQTSQKIANCIHDALTSSVPSKPLPRPEEGEWVQAS